MCFSSRRLHRFWLRRVQRRRAGKQAERERERARERRRGTDREADRETGRESASSDGGVLGRGFVAITIVPIR